MDKQRRRTEDGRPDAAGVASATECTGLMPALPETESEDEASASLYGVLRARDVRERRRRDA